MRLRRSPAGFAAAAFADAGRPADGVPWREARWCAVDLEMTGLDPRSDEIIAIGAVPIEDGRIVLGRCLYTLVRTSKRSKVGAVLVHKLRLADVAEAPSLEEAIDLVLGALAGSVPVFHTARIEAAFLERQFARRHLRLPAAADTEALGRRWLEVRGEAVPALSLGRLADALGQPAEAPHHALGDALTTAKAFVALASLLDAREPQTVGTLVAASAGPGVAGGGSGAGVSGAARRFGPG
jgi:DNA polymerase III subunit epsilon